MRQVKTYKHGTSMLYSVIPNYKLHQQLVAISRYPNQPTNFSPPVVRRKNSDIRILHWVCLRLLAGHSPDRGTPRQYPGELVCLIRVFCDCLPVKISEL